MSDDKPKPNAFEGTLDSVAGAVSVLWDWLSAPPKDGAKDENPSIIGLLSGEASTTDSTLRCARCKQAIVENDCACEPPNVLEAEGREV